MNNAQKFIHYVENKAVTRRNTKVHKIGLCDIIILSSQNDITMAQWYLGSD